jgi:hypothetical protein
LFPTPTGGTSACMKKWKQASPPQPTPGLARVTVCSFSFSYKGKN